MGHNLQLWTGSTGVEFDLRPLRGPPPAGWRKRYYSGEKWCDRCAACGGIPPGEEVSLRERQICTCHEPPVLNCACTTPCTCACTTAFRPFEK